MSTYKRTRSRNQPVPPIASNHVTVVLADFSTRRASPLLRAYFTGTIDPAAMRRAWVKALVDFDADQLHAVAFTLRKIRAREALSEAKVSCRSDILAADVMERAHG